MAVGIERKQYSNRTRARKRKRGTQSECSLSGTDPVEVRSEEEGFLGSWHQGTVIACNRQLSSIKYDFKYDHMLVDDGSDHIVCQIFVPLDTGGIDCFNANQHTRRGVIRPVPPKLEFTEWNLPYGTCVDVNHTDCWWEGVIFDHEDGAEERKIFFPDQGDEMIFHFGTLRITQDWIDATDTWQRRGTWLFLELIEEYEQECFVHVSVKQLWYDLREKEGFQKLGDWTSSVKALWEEMLLEVIGDNNKIVVNHLIQAIGIPEGTQHLLEFVKPFEDVDIDCEAELAVPLAVVPDDSLKGNMSLHPKSSNVMSPQGISDVDKLVSTPVNEVSTVNLSSESNLSCHDKYLCVLSDPLLVLPTNQDGISFITGDEGFSSSNTHGNVGSYSSSLHGETRWLPVGPDTVSGADLCPDAVTEYLRNCDRRPLNVVTNDVRKHLAHLKWKIDFMTDKGRVRLRYTSPDGKFYYSLRQVCLYLSKTDTGIVSPVSRFEQRDMHSFPNNSSLPLTELETENLDSYCSSGIPSDAEELNVEPKYCPEAIAEWCNFESKSKIKGKSKKAKVVLRAKKHLAALGWVFWHRSYNGKRTLYYRSPTGRSYCSLRQACRHLIDKSDSGGTLSIESCTSHLEKPPELPKLRAGKTQPSRVLRSSKRVQRVIVPNPLHHNPRTVLSWLIENNVLLPRAKVRYIVRKGGRPVVEGRIARDGIKCNCCGKVYSLSGFQVHATRKCRRETSSCCLPAASIFLEDGRSLFDCQKMIFDEKMRNSGRELADRLNNNWHQGENDYICSVCHSVGRLILCDQCPSSFHPRCLGLKDVPAGAWFCPSCCCRICGENKLKKDIEPFVDGSITCVQCERKYHVWCLGNGSADQQDCYPKEDWFCSQKCEAVFLGLRELLGKQIPVRAANLTWTLYKYTQSNDHDPNASENESLTETYSKLSIALDVMHECFEPFEEPLTRRDLMKDVIFSQRSELNRLNFRGFYTALLEKDGDLVTVATVRVFGDKVAEVPLIGTRFQYRRLGMCRILMHLLEEKLLGLGVQRLVLPAVPSVLQTWTGSFGFSKMTDLERLDFIDHTFLDFQGTIMCQKLLMKIPSTKSNLSREILNTDVGGSSAISEVVQTNQITQWENMEQGQVDVLAGNGSTGTEDPVHKVNRSTDTNKRSRFDSIVVWKTYKRRKKSLIQNLLWHFSDD